ncbi:NmrA/HSCARG family protein [Agrobacterium tumefaciens]|uniref:NmrA/HSCARG family protein n=1 Tax=Agrobacterium tumefaciens TaxID=358 RepID=UPI003BA10076
MKVNKSVLVLGATGQQGGAVARSLRQTGWLVRTLVRDTSSPKSLALARDGMQLYKGDMEDRSSIESAMAEVDAVFSVQPSSGQGEAYGVTDEQEVFWGKMVVDIAKVANVGHLVYSSVIAAGKGVTGMGHFDSKSAIEAHVQELGVAYTIIRPSTFMEILALPGMGLDQGKFNFFMRPDQAMQFIAVDDIGKIVAHVLNTPEEFSGRTLDIAGDAITGVQLQWALSRALRRPIKYSRFSDRLLTENAFLHRLAVLVDDGRLAGSADLPSLRQQFGDLTKLVDWLSGPGKPLIEQAAGLSSANLSLR